MERIICIIIGYVFGLFSTGTIVGKLNGVNLRNEGSKNVGATNALRTLGAKMGALVLLGDAFKCVFAIIICRYLFRDSYSGNLMLISLYAAMGAILGHNFPITNKFKGGKGIACTAGCILSFGPVIVLICLIVFFGLFFITHYVSVCSIVLYIACLIVIIVAGQTGMLEGQLLSSNLYEAYIIVFLLMLLAIFMHRENIKRLLSHCENKTYLSKKNK